jgi:succinate dehydrogenase / fumarate reductase cytochrome b subunit
MIPVGIFLVYHLYTQLYLHQGAEKYNEQTNAFYNSPLAIWLLIIFVYMPLFYHSILGAKLSIEATPQPSYHYFAHLLYWLQRISGIGVLLFIFAHLYNTQVMPLLNDTYGQHFEHLADGFASAETGWLTKSVYLLGILGATFHFANGINTFCMTWGLALTPRAQLRVRVLSIIVFILLTGVSLYSMSAIW